MNKTMVILTAILLLVGSFSLPMLGRVHGATGTVCLVNPTATGCPASPASLTGSLGSQLRVAVFLQGTNVINGFDITVLAAHTIIRPIGVSLNGTILPGPQVVLECLGGLLIAGNVCASTDNVDTLDYAVLAGPGSVSTATTGLLFTAIYNVTGTTTGTPISFQTGCSGTSTPNTCVAIVNGAPTPVPETVQTAVFSTSATPDFFMVANPSSITITAGTSATSTLSVTSVNSFSGTVTLNAAVSPSGIPVTISPTSIALMAGQTLSSTVSLSTSPSTPPGTYSITVTGTSGTLVHSATITLQVNPTIQPDFSITASPTSLTIKAGSSGASTVTVKSLNGFAGTVNLAASVNGTGLSATLNASSVTLSSGGSATSTATVSTTISTPPGTYTVTIKATSSPNATITHSVVIAVTVPSPQADFSISASPTSLTIPPGGSATSTITVASINGFSGVVALTVTAPSGATASISPSSVTGSGTATLTLTASQTGTFTIQVTGISGSLSHSVSVTLSVSMFGVVCIISTGSSSCPSSPPTITGTPGTQLRVSIFIQNSAPLNGFDITLLADHTKLRPAGIDLTGTILILPTTIVNECLGGVIIHGNVCPANADTLELAVVGANGLITSIPTGLLFTAIYNVTGSTTGTPIGYLTGCSGTSVPGTCITITNGSTSPVPETAQTATFSTSVAPDFSITATESFLLIAAGFSNSTTIILSSLNGFNGTVLLHTSPPPLCPSCPGWSISPTSVSLPPGGSAVATLTVTAGSIAVSGNVTVSGVSGSLTHSVNVAFKIVAVPHYVISANPTSVTIIAGSAGTSTITVQGFSGFTGTVALTAAVSPPGLSCVLNPTAITLNNATSIGTSTLSCTGSAGGTFTVSVTGTSNGQSQTVFVNYIVLVQDFTITVTPSSQTIERGTSTTFTITVTGTNGFNSTVTLTATISPLVHNGPTLSLPSTVGPYSHSTLTVSTAHSTPVGTYTITVTATSGSLTHTVTITITVTH